MGDKDEMMREAGGTMRTKTISKDQATVAWCGWAVVFVLLLVTVVVADLPGWQVLALTACVVAVYTLLAMLLLEYSGSAAPDVGKTEGEGISSGAGGNIVPSSFLESQTPGLPRFLEHTSLQGAGDASGGSPRQSTGDDVTTEEGEPTKCGCGPMCGGVRGPVSFVCRATGAVIPAIAPGSLD